MAQDAGDEFFRALLKVRFPGTEEEDREAEREEAAREAGSGVANPVAAATPALLESGSDMAAGSGVANPIAAVHDMVDRGMNISVHSRVATAQNVEATAAARRQEQERQNDEVCCSSGSDGTTLTTRTFTGPNGTTLTPRTFRDNLQKK